MGLLTLEAGSTLYAYVQLALGQALPLLFCLMLATFTLSQ